MSPSSAERRVGRYVMHARIAAGGMASVYFGRMLGPAGFTRAVAIKRMHEHLAADAEFASMFLDEARLSACIQHPNVVSTLDIVDEHGELFLVMDYVVGESLSTLISAVRLLGERIPLGVVTSIMCGVLAGLHAAHEAISDRGEPLGIVHRDVSPHNVLVGADGVARIADFGVAKAAMRLQSTHGNKVKGKLAYMSPEQLLLRPVDRRSDVYAAAVVLWEMLTLERLFSMESPGRTVLAITEGVTRAPSELRRDVPPALDAVVKRALSVDVSRRFVDALDLVGAIEAAVPPASAREVARWIASVAGEALADRRAPLATVATASRTITVTHEPLEDASLPIASPLPFARRATGAIALALAALVALVFVVAHCSSSGEEIARASTTYADLGFSPHVDQTERADTLSSTSPAPVTDGAIAASVARQRPLLHAPAARATLIQTPSSTTCSPPFTIDAHDVKRFKRECF